ncbi:hypothetical protein CEXT_753501, partial [Caerostris extrusa]
MNVSIKRSVEEARDPQVALGKHPGGEDEGERILGVPIQTISGARDIALSPIVTYACHRWRDWFEKGMAFVEEGGTEMPYPRRVEWGAESSAPERGPNARILRTCQLKNLIGSCRGRLGGGGVVKKHRLILTRQVRGFYVRSSNRVVEDSK